MSTKINRLIIALLTMVMVSAAFAMGQGPFLGLEVGESNTHNNPKTVYQSTSNIVTGSGMPLATSPILTPVLVQPTHTGFAARVFTGYNFNDYLALEGAFFHYAPGYYNANTASLTPQCNSASPTGVFVTPCTSPTVRENGFDFEGKGIWAFPYGLGVFGKLGFGIIQISYGGSLIPNTTSANGSGTSVAVRPLVGVGASFDFAQNWQVVAEVTRIIKGGSTQNADFAAVGLSYHWIDKFCGQFLC